jgi:hypothetical protein
MLTMIAQAANIVTSRGAIFFKNGGVPADKDVIVGVTD